MLQVLKNDVYGASRTWREHIIYLCASCPPRGLGSHTVLASPSAHMKFFLARDMICVFGNQGRLPCGSRMVLRHRIECGGVSVDRAQRGCAGCVRRWGSMGGFCNLGFVRDSDLSLSPTHLCFVR